MPKKGCTQGHISKSKIIKKKKTDACCNPDKPIKQAAEPPPLLKSVLETPQFIRTIGPKQIDVLTRFIPSAIVYGMTSLVLLTYLADWRLITNFIPYYSGKYDDEEKK